MDGKPMTSGERKLYVAVLSSALEQGDDIVKAAKIAEMRVRQCRALERELSAGAMFLDEDAAIMFREAIEMEE